ncbi:hypothetical protein [Persephonella sp.]
MSTLTEFFLEEFRELKKRYYRFFLGGIIFILFGYVYIIEPFFSYQNQKKALSIELKAQEEQVKQIRKVIDVINKSVYLSVISSEEINSRLEVFPYELAAVITEYTEYFSRSDREPVNQTLTEDDFDFYKTFSDSKEAVKWYVKGWYENLFKIIKIEILKPLTDNSISTGLDKAGLIELYYKTTSEFDEYYQNLDENFWKKYSLIVDNKSLIAEEISDTFRKKIDSFLNDVKVKIDQFKLYAEKEKEKEKDLIEKSKKLIKFEDDLEAKLLNINSPIGNLPVNLADFIKTFPFIISFISLLVFGNFIKLFKIRKILMEISSKNQENRLKIIYSTDIILLQKFIFLLIFSVIFVIYLRSVYLIINNVDLFRLITGKVNIFELFLYSTLYFIGFIIFTYIFSVLIMGIKGTEPSPDKSL